MCLIPSKQEIVRSDAHLTWNFATEDTGQTMRREQLLAGMQQDNLTA